MAQNLQSLARQAAPWRPGFPWWIAALQGFLAAAAGLWIVLATEQSARVATLLLGGWLLVAGVLEVAGAERRRAEAEPLQAARAGAGLLGGLIVVLQPAFGLVDEPAARAVLGVALATSALGALLGAVLGSAPARARGLAALGALLYATLGWLLLRPEPGGPALRGVGAVTAVLGLVLLGYGVALRRRRTD